LYLFAVAHRENEMKDWDQTEIEQKVHEIISTNKLVVPPSHVPVVISRWSVNEVLIPVEESDWNTNYWGAVKTLATINDDDVKRFFPEGNENTQNRASLLVEGSNYDLSMLAWRLCTDKEDGMHKKLFKCKCLPSQKTKEKSENQDSNKLEIGYTVYLCFDDDSKNIDQQRVLPYPYSCCGCHNGRGFCSHCLGMLGLFMLIQEEVDRDFFESYMPESPIDTQVVPILIELMTMEDSLWCSQGYFK
jgi:hypothetical protein